MPSLTVTPSPILARETVTINGTGFQNAKTRLTIDGAGSTTNIFRPSRDGSFRVGMAVGSRATVQVVRAQQYLSSTWVTVAQAPVDVRLTLGPIPTLDLRFPGSSLSSIWKPVYPYAADPGFGLDSHFLGNTSQASVANGLLTITAERRAGLTDERTFASACIGTMGTWQQLYGIFEARIRHPRGQGSFPAFWMLRAGSNQTPPEIDIMEAYPGGGLVPSKGSSGSGVIVQTLHAVHPTQPPPARYTRHVTVDGGEDLTLGFHVYRVEWRPDFMEFSFDGEPTLRLTGNIPNVPMYPILNLAMGADGYRTDSSTPPVLKMDVEYVRAWA